MKGEKKELIIIIASLTLYYNILHEKKSAAKNRKTREKKEQIVSKTPDTRHIIKLWHYHGQQHATRVWGESLLSAKSDVC